MLEALKCPTCGGPVRLRGDETLTLCLYCNGALKVSHPAGTTARIEVDPNVDGATIDRIKALILKGKRDEATALYRDAAKCDAATAAGVIDTYVRAAVNATILSSTLNAFGFFLYLGALALVGGGIAGIARELLPLVAAVVLIALGGVTLIVLTKPMLRSLRYLGATRAEATILRFAPIGQNADVTSFLMLLQVREPSGSTFETEVALPSSKEGAAKMRNGRRFWVKYFPGQPASVTFDAKIDD
jgi:hypothetical protein